MVSVTGTHIAVVTFSETVANQTCRSMTTPTQTGAR
jgi:hypothetical protein